MRYLPRIVVQTPFNRSVPVIVMRRGQQVRLRVRLRELHETEQNQAALVAFRPSLKDRRIRPRRFRGAPTPGSAGIGCPLCTSCAGRLVAAASTLALPAIGRELRPYRLLNKSKCLPVMPSFCSRSPTQLGRLRKIRAIRRRATGSRREPRRRSIGCTPIWLVMRPWNGPGVRT